MMRGATRTFARNWSFNTFSNCSDGLPVPIWIAISSVPKSLVDTFENNQCNDGSLLFKLSGENESMLFCSDVQKEMEQFIVPGNEEKLKADFVQCGHHGNWGLTTEFYDIVDPKAAFMDSPSYILEDTEGYYDAPQLVEYFNNRGTAIYSFKDAPNTVNLH